MQFSYTAFDNSGNRKKGKLEANNEKEVVTYLREIKLTPLQVKEITKTKFKWNPFSGIKNGDIVLFTRQLSSMILTGLTLLDALNILKQQENKVEMRNMIGELVADISEGKTFSQALENQKKYFSEVYIAFIKAAETSGLLDKILERLANNLERDDDLKKRVKSALFYPLIVITGVIAVIVIMNIFVIPQLATLYASLDVKLPITTRIVLWFSNFVRSFYPVFIVLGILGFFAYKRLQKTTNGLQIIDHLKLKIPVVGSILTLSILDEISRTLSLLISSGSPILGSLKIVEKVSGNYGYQKGVEASTLLVEKGIPLSQSLEAQHIFPPIFIQMVKVGESTGRIDESLEKVAQYFERDLDLKIKTLTTSIEPILIIVLGVTVGFLIFSVITPIYGLISKF
jgi:type IV pilus assembly protein PilC